MLQKGEWIASSVGKGLHERRPAWSKGHRDCKTFNFALMMLSPHASFQALLEEKMSFLEVGGWRFRLQIKTHLGILRNILEEGS